MVPEETVGSKIQNPSRSICLWKEKSCYTHEIKRKENDSLYFLNELNVEKVNITVELQHIEKGSEWIILKL